MTPKERLTLLADFLMEVPVKQFEMFAWRAGRDCDDETLMQHKCGTSACAVGWACAMPEFKAEGLHYALNGPVYGPDDAWNAVRMFFGLQYHEATALFSSDSYEDNVAPVDVATRIRLFMRDPEEALEEAREYEESNMPPRDD